MQITMMRFGGYEYGGKDKTDDTVILEIDPPTDPVSIRRKGFYERCGYRDFNGTGMLKMIRE